MTDKEIYKFFRKHWNRVGDEIRCEARSGDKNAAMDMLSYMIVSTIMENAVGYEMSNAGNRIIKRIRPNKQSIEDELAVKASTGDIDAANELLKMFSDKIPTTK